MAITSTRLCTNSCALSSRKVISSAPFIFENGKHGVLNCCILAFYQKNKGAAVDNQARVHLFTTFGFLLFDG
jgi:hypothetical protein